MKITWYGHAAFGIEGRNDAGESVKIILDPYNYPGAGGYLPIDEPADIVSVSHDNPRYHSDTSSIQGDFELVDGLALAGSSRVVRGVRFEAFEVHENDAGEGPNALVKLSLEGVTVAHMGDLGHPLQGASLEFLRGVGVLLALAGGPPTIDLADLVEVIELTRPPLVLPMHYKTEKVNLNLLTIDHFLRLCPGFEIERQSTSSIEVTAETLPAATRIVVLEHAR